MHIHEWSRLSSHATSEGQVVYVRCDCGAHSVELVPRTTSSAGWTVAVVETGAGRRWSSPSAHG